ncbi:MAG: proline iminopeptidase-family hydrolase [Gammaproteobacteria bacterium]|nr:proline iminopeptidase-family hydrolase [Gammaproteobacteria bacterium]
MTSEEGYVHLQSGQRVWYRRVGDAPAIPLLLLHGGPGAGHDYLEPLAALAGVRPVVFYDQLGCGRSDCPDDTSLWRIERYCREIDELRAALGLERVHLLGQSWGGWLAIEYLLGRPAGIAGLVLASTSASIAQFVREAEGLKRGLPADVQATLQRYEAAHDYHHPHYAQATMAFYRRHVCRLPQWPDCVMRTLANLDGNPVYETMNGPNEFTVIGNLKDWDRTARLGEIDVPTLITVGRHDEITPACARTLHAGIRSSQLVVFEHSAHMAHLEEPQRYRQVLERFLRHADGGGAAG